MIKNHRVEFASPFLLVFRMWSWYKKRGKGNCLTRLARLTFQPYSIQRPTNGSAKGFMWCWPQWTSRIRSSLRSEDWSSTWPHAWVGLLPGCPIKKAGPIFEIRKSDQIALKRRVSIREILHSQGIQIDVLKIIKERKKDWIWSISSLFFKPRATPPFSFLISFQYDFVCVHVFNLEPHGSE